MTKPVQRVLDQRRQRVEQVEAMAAGPSSVWAKILLKGSGEELVSVNFPIVFPEEPLFTFGAALADNHSAEDTNFPVASAVVAGWDVKEMSEQRNQYRGATVACVALGKEDQEVWIHCLFQGVAFSNPTGDDDTQLDDVI